jgi:uncharacterized protein (TIGR02145 family)
MRKIILPIIFIVFISNAFAQTMVVKKSDGTYQEIAINDAVELSFYLPCPGTPTVTYEGKTYNSVQIGNQCWLKENLDVGTMINSSGGGTNSDGNQTNNATLEKYCYNDDPNNCNTYGGLYQWGEAVQYKDGASNTTSPSPAFSGNVQGICPYGWHIPTNVEFQTLASTVGNDGKALIEIGEGGGTNTSGFSALLAGRRYSNSYFFTLGDLGYFRSSTESSTEYAYFIDLYNNDSTINFNNFYKQDGYSVRCVKD